MKSNETAHVYVHMPFCDGKCLYCAFYSELYTSERADRFLDCLAIEFDRAWNAGSRPAPETIYFGGGTTSVLDAPQLRRLCDIVRSRTDARQLKEWTIEANPGGLTERQIGLLVETGVNRLSLGVQSFDDDVLKAMGRRHTSGDVEQTVRLARKGGLDNIGMDLIAGLPGVYEKAWRETLRRTAGLHPAHVSVYALSIEDGSHMGRLSRTGAITVPDDDAQAHALAYAESFLGEAGYGRYEISNYALPGRECLHNSACWQGEDYRGFGPAAASRAGRRRWTNRPDIGLYLAALSAGEDPPGDADTLDAESDAAERLVFAFRLADGVDVRRYGAGFDTLRAAWEKALAKLAGIGLVERQGQRWTLTARGRGLADFVAYELLNAE